ncbi:hypothetical protein LINPERPRIM_LOCUS31816 [Linum perenne]
MNNSSAKLALAIVLLVFFTWSIGAEGRANEVVDGFLPKICRKHCHKPCHCFYGNCLCPKDDQSTLISSSAQKSNNVEGEEGRGKNFLIPICDSCNAPCHCYFDGTCHCPSD